MNAPPSRRAGSRRRPELAEVVVEHRAELERRHGLTSTQHRALSAIAACRTPALGGHVERCRACGASRVVYRSCRSRRCPKCQTLAKERWVQERCADLLPVPYFHVVFTLPHQLNGLLRRHARLLLGALFRCASQTLREFAHDPRHLGAELGVSAVLHTWSQTLSHHVHLHCLVTAGGLALDGSRWIHSRNGFLFPVRALSRVFRGKYLAALDEASRRGEIPAGALRGALRRQLRRRDWVVYCKPPFAGPEHLLAYLGRYTHRIAISNDRLVRFSDGNVAFSWRDRARGDVRRTMTLPAVEFLRRFVTHVLPDGFQRIRHYGLHANRRRRAERARCLALLPVAASRPSHPAAAPVRERTAETVLRVTGLDISRCPSCGERAMRCERRLAPTRSQRGPPGRRPR